MKPIISLDSITNAISDAVGALTLNVIGGDKDEGVFERNSWGCQESNERKEIIVCG